jgi:hypothetical protein
VDPSSQAGGNLEIGDDFIQYSPPVGHEDQDGFSFTVGDGRGGIATGLVTITVFPETDAPRNLSISPAANDRFRIAFLGAPDRDYSVEFAEELPATQWQAVGQATADGQGGFHVELPVSPGASTGYFRARYP